MKEALVTARKIGIKISDLGRELQRGQSIYLSVAEASQSKDLQWAVTQGVVELEWVERSKVARLPQAPPPPAPPFARVRPGVRNATQAAPTPSVDFSELTREIQLLRKEMKVRDDLKPVVDEIRGIRPHVTVNLKPLLEEIRGLRSERPAEADFTSIENSLSTMVEELKEIRVQAELSALAVMKPAEVDFSVLVSEIQHLRKENLYLSSQLLEALKGLSVVQNTSTMSLSGTMTSDEPVFIPRVDTQDLQAKVSVIEQDTDSSGVDEATRALKEARKKR